MTDLFKKLNTLVKASLNDLVSEAGNSLRGGLNRETLGPDIEGEVKLLRQRVNEALDYETQLQSRVKIVNDEVDRWDREADSAVARGNDDAARHALEQKVRAEQRLRMAQDDVEAHRAVTQELMGRVNQLEAAVADARRSEAAAPAPPVAPASVEDDSVAARLRDIREKLVRDAPNPTGHLEDRPPSAPSEKDDDDLEQRRQRLSKP